MYPLLEVDTQFEAKNGGQPSVLRTLVDHKRLHHLGVRQIRSLIKDKWHRSANIVFWLQTLSFLLVLIILVVHLGSVGAIHDGDNGYMALLVASGALLVTFLPPVRTGMGMARAVVGLSECTSATESRRDIKGLVWLLLQVCYLPLARGVRAVCLHATLTHVV